MEPSSLPVWAQGIFYAIIAIGTAGIGLFRYFKTEAKKETAALPAAGSSSVISASFIDSKLLRELVEALRDLQDEQGRDAKKLHRLLQDVKEALSENSEAVLVQTDATLNLVKFVNRRNNSPTKLSDEVEEY
jgi:hypothetical protein